MYMIFNILNLFVLLNLLYCLVLLYSSELFNAGMYFYLMNNKDTGELNFFVRSLQRFIKYFKFKTSILLVITSRPIVLYKYLVLACVSLCRCTFPKTRKTGINSYPSFCSRIGPLFRSNWALPFFTFSMGDILVYPWTLSI